MSSAERAALATLCLCDRGQVVGRRPRTIGTFVTRVDVTATADLFCLFITWRRRGHRVDVLVYHAIDRRVHQWTDVQAEEPEDEHKQDSGQRKHDSHELGEDRLAYVPEPRAFTHRFLR